MSIKKLFESSNKVQEFVSNTTTKDAFDGDAESFENVVQKKIATEKYVPQLDYSQPENFAKYGSARLYYKSALSRITDFYPYDGSEAEINKFLNGCLDVERYILDNQYPKTTGYISLNKAGHTVALVENGFAVPSTSEHIDLFGGPGTGSAPSTKLKDLIPSPADNKYNYSNLYDESLYTTANLPSDYGAGTRTSNLRADFNSGVTLEFWLKTGSIGPAACQRQVLFDLWNNELSGTTKYGRMVVEITGAAATTAPFRISIVSGTSTLNSMQLGNFSPSEFSDWKHYSIVLSSASAALYVNGHRNATANYGATMGPLYEKNLVGRIGALVTASVPHAVTLRTGSAGSGRLSGSLDEFRYWKTARTSKQIGDNWFGQVRGGSNSDISNTTLGVYYKFNEGITGVTATDKIVLDYAGRVTNGVWTGYNTGARNTGSAIISASASTKEFLDPIIRTNHPDYINLENRLITSGTSHDYGNNSAFVNLVPGWVLDDNADNENSDLNYITHIMGTYFDKLYSQITDLPKLRNQTYTSGSLKPVSFAEHLPQSLGLYSPELFIDATVLEKFMNRSDRTVFENDLHEAKSLIYQNLYNNLTEIYKAKGTEQAIRNVLKCFNINDNLLALKINSHNTEFNLRNNLEQQLLKKNCINFAVDQNSKAIVYQKKISYPGTLDSDIAGSVTGSIRQYGYGFSYESNIIFPNYEPTQLVNNRLLADYDEVSLFGLVTVDGTAATSSQGTDTTKLANDVDYGNFKVFFVRDENQSKNGYFKLTYFDPTALKTVTLKSSVYNDVYDNTGWNLSVRVKPENYPLDTFVSGNIDDLQNNRKHKYEVIFSGYNPITTDLFNSFTKTAKVTTRAGKGFIESAKRAYVGANRTNLTGTVNNRSDVLVSSVAYWAKYLENTDLQQHSLDLENVGLSGSIQPLSPLAYLSGSDRHIETLGHDTLVFNWNFRNVTGSDAAGKFAVQDYSSGSAMHRAAFGWAGGLSGFQYTGYGFGFPASSTTAAKKQSINTYKFVDPERPVSSDMVQIFTDTDDLTPNLRREEIVPNFVYSLEKSLYNAVSEEMLDFFAGVIDFNDIIGHPVHYYRDRYKDMEKLRESFFRRVTEVSTIEKYTEYYKWFDDAITTIISQLVPASSEYVNDIQNVVESHVLERNKYQNKLNILDSNKFDLERVLPFGATAEPAGGGSGPDSYTEWATTMVSSPRSTTSHIPFWRKRADRKSPEITSGNPIIDAQRNTFRDIIYSQPNVSGAAAPPTLKKLDGTKYAPGNSRKRLSAPFRLNAAIEDTQFGKAFNNDRSLTRNIKGGTNFESNKNFDFAASIVKPAGPINREGGKFVPLNVMIGFVSESTEIPVFRKDNQPSEMIVKKKKTFKVQTGRDWESGLGYKNVKSGMAFPFNVFSSSVEVNSGYNSEVISRVASNLMITNLHNDVYGDQLEKPMQGPFTDNVVGGHQSRHIDLNIGTDQQNNRPEAWRILLGTCDIVPSGAIGVVGADYPPPSYNPPLGTTPYPYPFHEKAYFYRDFVAKRPVNIKNISRIKNNKTVPGNYDKQYEVVHSFGAHNNARAFIDNQPALPSKATQVNSTTNVRTILDIHRGEQSHAEFIEDYSTSYLDNTNNKSVIVTKFSAPGGIEVQTRGYQDFKSAELSPYNSIPYRNLTVLKPSQGPSGSISEAHGGTPSTMRVSDIHNKDYGLTSHTARHAARFGRDSVFVASPGTTANELPAFHKTQRNIRRLIKPTNVNNTTFTTSSLFDNLNVQRPIPQSDRQYLWLSRSVLNVSDMRYAGYQRTDSPARNLFRTSSAGLEYYWVFVSSSDATIGAFAQPTHNLNIIINDPISASTNTIGYPAGVNVGNYTNTALVGAGSSTNYLNQLLTSRGATHGWGWNKFHQNKNKILTNDRRLNQLTIATGSDETLSTYVLRPLSLKGRHSYINFDILSPMVSSPSTISQENVTLKFTNTNEKIFFNELELNNYAEKNLNSVNEPYRDALNMVAEAGTTTLNWFLYRQNIFPTIKNEFSAFSSRRVGYDNKFWRSSNAERRVLGNTLSSSMAGAIVSKSAWVLDAPQNFLTRTSIFGTSGSQFLSFIPTFFTRVPYLSLTGTAGYNTFVPAAGELQNTYFSYFTANLDGGKFATMQIAPLYARKHSLSSPKSVVSPAGVKIPETGSWTGAFTAAHQIETLAGEAEWEAARQAGIIIPGPKPTGSADNKILTKNILPVFSPSASSPWFGNYNEFNKDLRLLAKGYSVIPEYRMSEHVKDYFNYGVNNESKNDFFEIVGTNSSSADRNFYKDYSNSDFLDNFLGIKKESLLNAKEIKLSCDAAIRYNPYKGFYPAQRTVDLAAQFADSFKDSIGMAQSGSSSGLVAYTQKAFDHQYTLYERAAGLLKIMLDPLVSPGILYNSIKSGIAVDYPIVSSHRKRLRRAYGTNVTASTNNWALSITGAGTLRQFVSGTAEYAGGQYWDKRIPFEAIIEPRKYILNTNFIDMESHPSMSLDWNWAHHKNGPDRVFEEESFTGSFSDNADGIYTMMARNFFGGVGEFFLDGAGITKLESNTVLNDIQFTKDNNFEDQRPLYMARIKLRRSHNGARTYEKENDSYGVVGAKSFYGVNGGVRTINGTSSTGQYPLPQDPMNNSKFKETFTMYSRPTAFGPPCAGRPTGSDAALSPFSTAARDSFSGYNPAFTPPYYDGEAWADLIFRPHVLDRSDIKTATAESYDLNRILNEVEVVCWRFDAGVNRQLGSSALTASMPVLIPVKQKIGGGGADNDNTVPSIYDGKRINVNSMQLTSSVKIFGTKRVMEQETDKFGNVTKNANKPVGSKWIIQPKWETPMLNFNDEGAHPITVASGNLTLPTYGSASVPRGMWHQFGVIPDDPNKGIFLEITDIPESWLKNHYEVLADDRATPYNGNSFGTDIKSKKRTNLYKHVRSLSSLCGFDKTNSSTKLGQLKESFAVHEAVVAIPYVLDPIEQHEKSKIPLDSKLRKTRKSFISIPKRRFGAAREEAAGSQEGDSLFAAGESIRRLKQSMEKYVFPPEFDFLKNKEVDPIAMYIFEFKYEFDKDDLSYMWQNLSPRDSDKLTFQNSSISHNLADNELINEKVLMNENLRWMVFKIKQRAQTDYYDLIPDQANESTRQVEQKTTKLDNYKFGFNWPYDYLSFVELIKMDVDILLKKDK